MNAIETKGLTKYYGKARGIEDLNLTVSEGEMFGFIGPNGAGKSTTIRTLLGLIKKSGGSAS
ncbi:MAG: ATP-binding cassette domain-containing protein, partial [Clostridia bacterium]|nr:ATP-binding cassette domain-containing protein [Clostridia bacterium]